MHRPRRRTIVGLSLAAVIGAGVGGAGVASAVGPVPTPIKAATFIFEGPNFNGIFSTCTGLGSTTDAILVQQNTPTGTKYVYTAGAPHFDKLVCSRPVFADLALEKWRGLVTSGSLSLARGDAKLMIQDPYGAIAASWSLTNVWPSELHDTPNTSGGLTETVTLPVENEVRNQ